MSERMPSAPGVYEADYYGEKVTVVLAYKCPVVLSGRIALEDEGDSIIDSKTWQSIMPDAHDVDGVT